MNEQLSALIDNELTPEEAERVLVALHASSNTAQTWEQYHLIGDAMRGDDGLSTNFKRNLMLKIEVEPTVLSPNATLKNPEGQHTNVERKMPAAWAMAASMAGVMMVGWMLWQTQMSQDGTMLMANQASSKSNIQVAQQDAPAIAEADIPDEYLVAHQATAPTASSYYIQPASFSK